MRKKTKENEVIFLEREEKDVQFYEIYGSSNVAEMCMLNDKYKAKYLRRTKFFQILCRVL